MPAAALAQVQQLRRGIGRSRKLVEQMLALAAAQLAEHAADNKRPLMTAHVSNAGRPPQRPLNFCRMIS